MQIRFAVKLHVVTRFSPPQYATEGDNSFSSVTSLHNMAGHLLSLELVLFHGPSHFQEIFLLLLMYRLHTGRDTGAW